MVEGALAEPDRTVAPQDVRRPGRSARTVGAAPRRQPSERQTLPIRRPSFERSPADRSLYEPEVAVVRRPTFARVSDRPLPRAVARPSRRDAVGGGALLAVAAGLVVVAVASMALLLRGDPESSGLEVAAVPVPDAPRHPKGDADTARTPWVENDANAVIARAWDALMPSGNKPVRSVATEAAPRPSRSLPAAVAMPPTAARSPIAPPAEATTRLVAFDTAPFPYEGRPPGTNTHFLDVIRDGHRGHRTPRGRVYWQDETYSDRRVLLHVPKGFDPDQPGVMIVFFHGHGATLSRDVRDRQQVPAQISASGLNAVLVAPQFAVDAADSSAGQFWEPGAFKRFVAEAGSKLARMHDDPRAEKAFANMPVVIVGYSGGFLPTAYALRRGGLDGRVRGVVLLDGLYGEFDTFASWIANNRSAFFVSAYTRLTSGRNAELERMLRNRGVAFGTSIKSVESRGGVAFIATGAVSHRDFVTHAWVDRPLEDLFGRLAEYRSKHLAGADEAKTKVSLCGADTCP